MQKRFGALFQGVQNEGERAGAVSEVEQLLKKQQAMSPLVRLRGGCHGLSYLFRVWISWVFG